MKNVEQTLFTVGVFKDMAWAERGIEALRQQGFQPSVTTVMVKDGPEAASFVQKATGADAERLDLPKLGALLGAGPWWARCRAAPAIWDGLALPRRCAGRDSSPTTA